MAALRRGADSVRFVAHPGLPPCLNIIRPWVPSEGAPMHTGLEACMHLVLACVWFSQMAPELPPLPGEVMLDAAALQD